MSTVAGTRRSFWGWGNEGAGPSEEQARAMLKTLGRRYGAPLAELLPKPRIEGLDLRTPRLAPPGALAGICSTEALDRASHTYGKGYRDIVRAVQGDFSVAPDVVAFPRDESEVTALLDWCSDARAAAIPYGGGSSVVGGVEAQALDVIQ